MDVPTLSDSHRKLEKLTGKWSGEENLSGTGPGEAAREATSEITARLSLDGFFLVLDYARSHDGHVSFLGHGVCGWEQSKERYTLHWFDSTGFHRDAPSLGVWDDNVLTFHTKTHTGRHSRFVCTLSGSDECTFRIEETTDGVSWKIIVDARLHRSR